MVKISLNVNIMEIDIEVFKQRKKFKQFISDSENVEKYIPNKRFNMLVKKYYNIINKNGELNLKDIFDDIREDMGNNYTINDEVLTNIKDYLKELYKNSNRISEISTYFNTVKLVEIDISDLPKYSLPYSFSTSTFSSEKANYEEIYDYCKNNLGILFYYGNVSNIEVFDSGLLYVPNESIEFMKSILGDKSHLICYFDYLAKKIFLLNSDESEIKNLANIIESTIVVNYMVYDIENDDIKGIDTRDKEIYVYCDRTYPDSVELINSIAKEKCKARIIKYKNMYLLVIKVSNKTKFILPFIGIAYSSVKDDIDNCVLNIEFADNPDGVTETDDYIIKTPESVQVYDLIINCLFQLE